MQLLLLVSLFASSLAYTGYTPETYPDSMKSPKDCQMDDTGFLCDPSGILKKENGTQLRLKHALVTVQSKTKCVCDQLADNRYGKCDDANIGYTMSIALTQKMILNDDEHDKNTVNQAAEVFANKVRERQNRGSCQDDLLIFLSADDKVSDKGDAICCLKVGKQARGTFSFTDNMKEKCMVYTSVGENTKKFLSNEMISSITSHAEYAYFKKEQYYEGLSYMIDTYAKVLNNEPVKVTATKPWYYPLPLWAIIVILTVVGLILLSVIGVSIYCCAKKCCCKDGRGNYAMASSTSRL